METAPLTLAHTHARNAVLETKRSNPVAASEEHDLAAADYAAAAHSSADLEAKRILNLLEQHHKRLGEILKSRHEKPPTNTQYAQTASSDPPTQSITPSVSKSEDARSKSPEILPQPPRLSRPGGTGGRDLSSSIASNLASARGIPNNRQKRPTPISPLVSNQYADGHFAQDDPPRKTTSRQGSVSGESPVPRVKPVQSRPSWAPPVEEPEPSKTTDKSDAPFQQFYNTFESLFSRISAPLAFTGLPLISATPAKAASTPTPKSPTTPKTKTQSDDQPRQADYSQLISQAALRAVSGITNHPAESFYVVPTTGGTKSYAEIMTRVDREESRVLRHRREASDLSNTSQDDFVDAQSTIIIDPKSIRKGMGKQEHKVNGKTMEELALENEALKHLTDTLAKRLHVFEMSAQTSSAALAQSIRSIQRSPLATPEHSRGKSGLNKMISAGSTTTTINNENDSSSSSNNNNNSALTKRITDLEQILAKSDARAKKRDEENAKLRETIVKYRDKWENLKAGAKARREEQVREKERDNRRGKSGGGGSSGRDRGATADGGGGALTAGMGGDVG